MSQLLLRLREQLLVESDPGRRAELMAKQAGYLARIGRFEEARHTISEIRKVYGDGRSGRVTAFTMLAEGLALHFEELGSGAFDRIARAQLLGQAMKDRELTALSSAWRAHFEFEQSNFEGSVKSLRIALQTADETDHATRVRCAIVLFNAFALFGERSESQKWFLVGRDHALNEGDQASIDALLHSRATFGVARLRAQWCQGSVDNAVVALVRSEINSARNLQHLTHVTAHETYIDLCDARLKVIEGDFQKAIDLLKSIRNSGPYPVGHLSKELVDLEMAYCRASLPSTAAPGDPVHRIDLNSFAMLDIDDRMAATWMSHELAKTDARYGVVSIARKELGRVMIEYEQWVSDMRQRFSEFATP